MQNIFYLLTDILEKVKLKFSKILIVGEFNIHFCKMDDDGKQLSNITGIFNLKRKIFAPTRNTLKSKSCIDNAFKNINECTGEFITTSISDHKGILFELKFNIIEHSYTKKYKKII